MTAGSRPAHWVSTIFATGAPGHLQDGLGQGAGILRVDIDGARLQRFPQHQGTAESELALGRKPRHFQPLRHDFRHVITVSQTARQHDAVHLLQWAIQDHVPSIIAVHRQSVCRLPIHRHEKKSPVVTSSHA